MKTHSYMYRLLTLSCQVVKFAHTNLNKLQLKAADLFKEA